MVLLKMSSAWSSTAVISAISTSDEISWNCSVVHEDSWIIFCQAHPHMALVLSDIVTSKLFEITVFWSIHGPSVDHPRHHRSHPCSALSLKTYLGIHEKRITVTAIFFPKKSTNSENCGTVTTRLCYGITFAFDCCWRWKVRRRCR